MPDDATWNPTVYDLPGFHDPFSSISHLVGAVVFLFLGYGLLLRGRGDRNRLIYLGIYAFSCVFLFSMSGVYHMMTRDSAARAVMCRLDHNAIFILIAGTFTPGHGLLFRGPLRWGPLTLIWTAAVCGITLKSVFFNDVPEWIGLALYLALGWLGAFSGALLWQRFGYRFVAPLLWGGVAYSIGGMLDILNWFVLVPGVIHAHELFHVAVLIGALLHWRWVWSFADGSVSTGPAPNPHDMILSAGQR